MFGPSEADAIREAIMAARTKRRTEWHQINGMWTRTLGERGMRVRLFQKRKDGNFYRDIWLSDKGKDRQCLYTKDRTEADRIGRQLLAALLQNEPGQVDGPVLLKSLFERYCRESMDYLDNKPHTKVEYKGRMNVVVGFFGPDRDVRTLTASDCAVYIKRRFEGGVICEDGRVTDPVRARSVQADLKLLCTILRWATGVPVGVGKRLLNVHPLLGLKFPRELNPKRPVATWERFNKTRETIQALAQEVDGDVKRSLWYAVEMALVLLEATGRRRSSVVQLVWDDIDFDKAEIRWRADADKKGKEWHTPVPESLLAELRRYRHKVGALGGYLFPSPHDSSKPMSGDLFSSLVERAERKAGLPKLDGGLLHPYRRKWATERKHHPLKDVAEAGGWGSTQPLLTCYQQADRDTMLAVMSETNKVVDKAVMGR